MCLTLVQVDEARHFPIGPPTPIEAIKFRMGQRGLTPKDLQPMIGGLARFTKCWPAAGP
jgi:HTH-type transcriptional regulator/antitoxin HigA